MLLIICSNFVYFIVFRELKEKRKKTQEMNKKAKEDAKRAQKEKIIKEANEHIVEDDDKEYYRQEVGEEPDAGNIKLKVTNILFLNLSYCIVMLQIQNDKKVSCLSKHICK